MHLKKKYLQQFSTKSPHDFSSSIARIFKCKRIERKEKKQPEVVATLRIS